MLRKWQQRFKKGILDFSNIKVIKLKLYWASTIKKEFSHKIFKKYLHIEEIIDKNKKINKQKIMKICK